MKYGTDALEVLVGKTVREIYMDSDSLGFVTDEGEWWFAVYGDCCSLSYFYDFYGVGNLLENGPITEVVQVDLDDPDDEDARRGDVVVAYGYRFTTDHPKWGPVSSVFSFRNDSNGYYGGELYSGSRPILLPPRLTGDCVEARAAS